jgi:DeoR family glycerol-3-phosphate regulon repressor
MTITAFPTAPGRGYGHSSNRNGEARVKPRERQARILEIVGREGAARVEALADTFGISAETVRRDLDALAATGRLHKVRGGARRLKLTTEGSFGERLAEDAAAKEVIAAKLAQEVEPGDTLFLDTGTTTLACAGALAAVPRLTVITNSLHIALRLGEAEARPRVFLLGGAYGAGNAQTVGAMAVAQVARFQADHAVLSVAALDARAGAMDADVNEAQVARAMIDHARQVIVVAARTKIGRRAAFGVCRLDEIDVLVCDGRPEEGFSAALAAAGVALR